MMKRLKRPIAWLFCFIMLMNATACRESEQTAVEQNGMTSITCAWWGNDGRSSYTMEGFSIFHRLNPDINVEGKYAIWDGYVKRQNIFMNSHEEPDVMQINYDWIKKYSPDGTGFYDLNTLRKYIDLSGYTESELALGTVNGKLNAIPIALNAATFYYNKDMYDSYGLDIPETWDDFFEAAKVMRKDGIYPLGMGTKFLLLFLIANLEQKTGRSVCNADGELVLTKEDIDYMLEYYKRMFDEKVIKPMGSSDYNTFTMEDTSCTFRWVSGAETYCKPLTERGIKVVVGPYPKYPDAKMLGWYVKPASMYTISSTTEHPEQSARLLDFLINNEDMALLQKTEKGIPICDKAKAVLEKNNLLPGLENDGNNLLDEHKDEMNVLTPILESEDVYQMFKDEADFYIYGKDTKENVVDKIYNNLYTK